MVSGSVSVTIKLFSALREALGEGVSYRVYHGDDTSGIFLGVGEGVLDPKDQGIPKQEVFVNPKRRVVYPS